MPKMELRVVTDPSADLNEIQAATEHALSQLEEVEAYQRVDSQPRGLTGTEIAISFFISVASGVTINMIERIIAELLAKRDQANNESVEATLLEE
ncbi:MAG: hypothetical protein RhofKO_25660 [Rhodothermales bacterium]